MRFSIHALPLAAACVTVAATASLAGAQAVIYQSSFEGTDGGWTGTGDWERGVPSVYDPADPSLPGSSDFGNGGVVEASDGDELWATNLDGPHANSGATSSLVQTFDFTGIGGPIELVFDTYLNSGGNSFDMASVDVNGVELVLLSGTVGTYDNGGTPGDGSDDAIVYEQLMVDLSAFAGQSDVEVAFNFDASTVVARDGWYIDNVAITAVPEPAALGLLGLGGLALVRRR